MKVSFREGRCVRHAYLSFGCSMLVAASSIQTEAQSFIKTYPTALGSIGYAIKETSDGGFVLAGFTSFEDSTGVDFHRDMFVVRTDPFGDTLWTRSFGGPANEIANGVQLTSDGGYYVSGSTNSTIGGDYDYLLVKLDPDGDPIWSRTFGGAYDDLCTGSALTLDDGVVMTGRSLDANADANTFAVRTDAFGDTVWMRNYDPGENSYGNSVSGTDDGGFILAGAKAMSGNSEAEVIRIDPMGNVVWNRALGWGSSSANWASQTADSGFVVTGSYSIMTYLLRMDGAGTIQWCRTYDHVNYIDKGYCVHELGDGGFIFSGDNYLHPWMVRTNAVGDTLWGYVYSDGFKEANQVVPTADGGFAMGCLRTFSPEAGMQLVRTQADGMAPCAYPMPVVLGTLTPTLSSPLMTVAPYGTIGLIALSTSSGASIMTPCAPEAVFEADTGPLIDLLLDPASNRITLQSASGIRLVDVFDLNGRHLVGGSCGGRTCTIEVAQLTAGFYVVNCLLHDGSGTRIPFILR